MTSERIRLMDKRIRKAARAWMSPMNARGVDAGAVRMRSSRTNTLRK